MIYRYASLKNVMSETFGGSVMCHCAFILNKYLTTLQNLFSSQISCNGAKKFVICSQVQEEVKNRMHYVDPRKEYGSNTGFVKHWQSNILSGFSVYIKNENSRFSFMDPVNNTRIHHPWVQVNLGSLSLTHDISMSEVD